MSEKNVKGIVTYVYLDGNEIMLNIVDENSSVLITFFDREKWEKFKKTVNAFDINKNPIVDSSNQDKKGEP